MTNYRYDFQVFAPDTEEYKKLEHIAELMNEKNPRWYWGKNFRVNNIWWDFGNNIDWTTIDIDMRTTRKDAIGCQVLYPNEWNEILNLETEEEFNAWVDDFFARQLKKGYTVNSVFMPEYTVEGV